MERISQSVREGLISELKALDLSTIAAKTYLALLYRPSASAGFLCNETGIPDSKIYYALNELSKKGMIAVQEGTPNTYKALHPKEAISNLKQQLVESFNKQISQAESLEDSLSPIYESVEGKDEIELAYVIRGRRNISRKMNELITSAKKEVLVLISENDLWDELSPSIAKVNDKVEAKIAVSRKLWKNERPKGKGHARMLECPINIVISDMRILITVSSWENEVAIMTNDEALMTISREYYENPKCCRTKC
jgi:sugar-specific transcriptional regulator TrmB